MIRAEDPDLAEVTPGGAANNPMGAAALTMRGGEYAIHGTNRPASIGGFVVHGCTACTTAISGSLTSRWAPAKTVRC